MANNYGRAGARKAQKGTAGYKYRKFEPMNVEERLTAPEIEEYRGALETLASPVEFEGAGRAVTPEYRARHSEAMQQASRLRELAATRAFEDVSAQAMKASKPWLVQKPTQLISEQTVPSSLGQYAAFMQPRLSFAGEGVRSAPMPGAAALAGEYKFGGIGYEEAGQLRKKKFRPGTLSNLTPTTTTTTPLAQQVDFGNLSFGPY